jgi:hypothetical protein
LIVGVVSGIVFLGLGVIVGVWFVLKRLGQNGRSGAKSASGGSVRDIEFVDGTLNETLVTFNDSFTIDGAPIEGLPTGRRFVSDQPTILITSFPSEV